MKTVYYDDMVLLMQDDAMEELGWSAGQTITSEQVYLGIAANARSLCRHVETTGADVDVSELASMCGHKQKTPPGEGGA